MITVITLNRTRVAVILAGDMADITAAGLTEVVIMAAADLTEAAADIMAEGKPRPALTAFTIDIPSPSGKLPALSAPRGTICMKKNEAKPVLRYDNLLFSSRGISEVHGKKLILFIPAAEIEHLELKFGRSEHRPLVSLAIGMVFILIGVFGLAYLFLAPRGFRYELAMMVFGFIGGTIIFDVLKQRYFIEVRRPKGLGRLVFSKNVSPEGLRDFCRQVGLVYGHQIKDIP